LGWFTRAHDTNPSQVDVAREAGLAALDCGAIDQAVRLCFAAVRLAPDDLGLQANLSLAYLLAGDDERASECAKVAVRGAPEDKISKAVHNFVGDVVAGRKKRPKKLSDAFPT
jgi:Flp pilus assembly protein TadD